MSWLLTPACPPRRRNPAPHARKYLVSKPNFGAECLFAAAVASSLSFRDIRDISPPSLAVSKRKLPPSFLGHYPSVATMDGVSRSQDQPAPLQTQPSYRSASNANHHYAADDRPSQPSEQLGGRFTEEWDASQRGTSIVDGHGGSTHRSSSAHSFRSGDDNQLPTRHEQERLSRGNTLKKKSSMRRQASLGRSSSRRSLKAGSVKSLNVHSANDADEANSAFYCPVPTTGNPTEVLTNRFQSKRNRPLVPGSPRTSS